MSVETASQVKPRFPKAHDSSDHWYCCDPDVSLCGYDISDFNQLEDAIEYSGCVVCDAILVCPYCGARFP